VVQDCIKLCHIGNYFAPLVYKMAKKISRYGQQPYLWWIQ